MSATEQVPTAPKANRDIVRAKIEQFRVENDGLRSDNQRLQTEKMVNGELVAKLNAANRCLHKELAASKFACNRWRRSWAELVETFANPDLHDDAWKEPEPEPEPEPEHGSDADAGDVSQEKSDVESGTEIWHRNARSDHGSMATGDHAVLQTRIDDALDMPYQNLSCIDELVKETVQVGYTHPSVVALQRKAAALRAEKTVISEDVVQENLNSNEEGDGPAGGDSGTKVDLDQRIADANRLAARWNNRGDLCESLDQHMLKLTTPGSGSPRKSFMPKPEWMAPHHLRRNVAVEHSLKVTTPGSGSPQSAAVPNPDWMRPGWMTVAAQPLDALELVRAVEAANSSKLHAPCAQTSCVSKLAVAVVGVEEVTESGEAGRAKAVRKHDPGQEPAQNFPARLRLKIEKDEETHGAFSNATSTLRSYFDLRDAENSGALDRTQVREIMTMFGVEVKDDELTDFLVRAALVARSPR